MQTCYQIRIFVTSELAIKIGIKLRYEYRHSKSNNPKSLSDVTTPKPGRDI
jgi:hypothetical protein